MHGLFVCLCIALPISSVYSAVSIQLPIQKPEEMADQVGCYVPMLNRVLPYNTPYSMHDGVQCIQFTCRGDNITSIFSCGVIGVPGGCAIKPGDKSLSYPECCDKITCNNINETPKPSKLLLEHYN